MNSMWRNAIDKRPLTRDESRQSFAAIVKGQLPESETIDLLVKLRQRGESSEEIVGAAQALLEDAVEFPKPDYLFADVVGTGGDGTNTINVSTAVAFVAAEAGLPIAKHGNRAVSSRCGAADLLEQFGFNLDMSPATARRCLDETGVTFLFAPRYHAGIRHATTARKRLATRTIFNILGPLLNPARPPCMLVGVYDPALCRIVAEALNSLGCGTALVVHGSGLDEIAVHGPTTAVELQSGKLIEQILAPADFQAESYPLGDLIGGPPEANARAIADLLSGKGAPAGQTAIAANAGALLKLAGVAQSFADGYSKASGVLATGSAFSRLERCARISRSQA